MVTESYLKTNKGFKGISLIGVWVVTGLKKRDIDDTDTVDE